MLGRGFEMTSGTQSTPSEGVSWILTSVRRRRPVASSRRCCGWGGRVATAAGAGRGRQLEQRLQAVRALAGEGRLGGADGSAAADADLEWAMLDSTWCGPPPAPPGKKSKVSKRLAARAAGFEKPHGLADGLGNPLAFRLTAGHRATPRKPCPCSTVSRPQR